MKMNVKNKNDMNTWLDYDYDAAMFFIKEASKKE